jgi:hypothetical protein
MEGVRSKTDLQVGPDQLDRKSTLHSPSNVADCIGKRCRSIEDEDATEHTRKRPRTQESRQYYRCSRPSVNITHPSAVNERHQIPKGKRQSQPRRKSTRLQEICDSSQQGIARVGKQTKPLPRPTETHPYIGQEQPQVERRTLRVTRKCQLDCVVDVAICNADQRSQTTPRSQGQGRKTTRMPPDEPCSQTGRSTSSCYATKLTQVQFPQNLPTPHKLKIESGNDRKKSKTNPFAFQPSLFKSQALLLRTQSARRQRAASARTKLIQLNSGLREEAGLRSASNKTIRLGKISGKISRKIAGLRNIGNQRAT